MKIARIAIKTLALKARAFERSTKDPMKAQDSVLKQYLRRNAGTEYGRAYGFSKIGSIKEYQKNVPMSDCESLRPYIERMAKGEQGLLTSDRVIFFGLTSGTTGHPKLIPVTEYSSRKKAEVAGLWSYYISRDYPRILNGKILAIVNPDVEEITPSGIPSGAETGHGYKKLPAPVRSLYALPFDVFSIPEHESRYYCIMRIAVEQDITTIATLNPTTIALLCGKVKAWRDDIISDIEKGSLRPDPNIPEEIRKVICRRLKPNPRRAAQLRSIVAERGELLPMDYWPNIQVIECWKAGTMKLYLKELDQYFPGVHVRDFGCLSTEARSSIPMSDSGAGGVLAINTNFYEFVPKEDISKKDKKFLLCNELEKGREYFLVVTTPGGLYRYNIDDIVTVDGYFNKTPLIEFVQKGLNAVSVMGEKLYESHVNEAVNRAIANVGLTALKFFSAVAQHGRPPRYAFLVEFENDPGPEIKRGLLASIEKELCAENAEYLYTRKIQVLGAPVLKILAQGSFEQYLARKTQDGGHDTQFKPPELTADQSFQDNFTVQEEIKL
jgi:hypothetical protein